MQTEKYMYVFAHWIGFPMSEYGGVWAVIASSHEECLEILKNERLPESDIDCVTVEWLKKNSTAFKLADSSEESKVVIKFVT